MSQIQLINLTPEELQNAIIKGVKQQFDELKKEYAPKEPTVWLTRNEVKDLLKVDLSTVHNYTKRKILKSYGISGRVYYKRHEVEEAIIALNV